LDRPDLHSFPPRRSSDLYTAAFLLFTGAVALFADSLQGLGTILALLLAGIAVALQDVLKSVVGWLYVSGRSGVDVGSRIEVNGLDRKSTRLNSSHVKISY